MRVVVYFFSENGRVATPVEFRKVREGSLGHNVGTYFGGNFAHRWSTGGRRPGVSRLQGFGRGTTICRIGLFTSTLTHTQLKITLETSESVRWRLLFVTLIITVGFLSHVT